jgi:hypothetical protein
MSVIEIINVANAGEPGKVPEVEISLDGTSGSTDWRVPPEP